MNSLKKLLVTVLSANHAVSMMDANDAAPRSGVNTSRCVVSQDVRWIF